MAQTRALRDTIAAGLALSADGADPAAGTQHDDTATPFVGRADELARCARLVARGARLRRPRRSSRRGGDRQVAPRGGVVRARGTPGRARGGRFDRAARERAVSGAVSAAQRAVRGWAAARSTSRGRRRSLAVLPELYAIRPALAPPAPLDERSRAPATARAFARFFDAVARVRPLVVVLEDLHWAPPTRSTRSKVLARRASGAPLLIVATYRSETRPAARHPLRATIRALAGEGRVTRVAPPPLDRGDVTACSRARRARGGAARARRRASPRSAKGTRSSPAAVAGSSRPAISRTRRRGAQHRHRDLGAPGPPPPGARTVADVAATVGRDSRSTSSPPARAYRNTRPARARRARRAPPGSGGARRRARVRVLARAHRDDRVRSDRAGARAAATGASRARSTRAPTTCASLG